MNPKNIKILFASKKIPEASLVAAAKALSVSGGEVNAIAASGNSSFDVQKLKSFFKEHSLGEIPQLHSMEQVDFHTFDLVVYLSDTDELDIYPRLPGNPPMLTWKLDGKGDSREEDLRQILERTHDLFSHGYLDALVTYKRHGDLVLESLNEGIIAHDLKRRIFLFNRAAERITGFNKEEVLGKDCHEVFPGKFCGEKCSFCRLGTPGLDELDKEYSVSLVSKDGKKRTITMNLFPIEGPNKKPLGVVAAFRDITEELRLRRLLTPSTSFHGMIGKDPRMQDLFALIEDVAKSNVPVLILGESGTGKELVASLIHHLSPRKDHLFVPVNCGAIPENLLESELFGHEKGAFTGAIREKRGRFELAHKGTLFLDEIGDLPLPMQVKLLRVLQNGTFERVGGEKTINVDVRIIAATNKDLKEAVRKGEFREDLYYRICVLPITIPPLRERKEDIPLLAIHFLKDALKTTGKRPEDMVISPEAMAILRDYDWPGNVRELQNAIQYALVRCKTRVIAPEHLPASILKSKSRVIEIDRTPRTRGRRPLNLSPEAVKEALIKTGGNKKQAASLLGISRASLYRYLQKNMH
ncbi:response regulator [Dissulfuribacter thermophilus]|uniref:Response regulator n=1 Tax=Dissulfuribacter thermophilus TaxID=1156395 RepID=A0A1B9F412_9BACT|nr:sigma 54-interacting transcriptional regulator [Dissulfuribacter thermophilus]OCC14593.1 response regulator [Dissulfuribacter thermophilus]